ncbi:MAG: RNA polymerase sigma factor for flagellar operon FliA, partial [Glaciecola sp.]
RQELWNAGALGLVDASRRFDPSLGIPFGRYALIRVRGAIIDSTRSRDWATRAVRRGMRDVNNATAAFEHEHSRAPTVVELAAALDMDIEQLQSFQAAAVTSRLLHLDQRVGGADSGDTTLGDLVVENDRERQPQNQLEHREMAGTLRAAVEYLPETQRQVIRRYYFEGDLLRDIADSMGVTEARISQIRSEALNAVRAYFSVSFDGVEPVDEHAPGRRSRAAFVSNVAEQTTWRSRLEAADGMLVSA